MSAKQQEKENVSDSDTFSLPTPHHISDVDTWGHPDRNYFIFVALTFIFGFIGLDHMYLRSNSTAFKKLLMNIFGLGIWYIWDIIQVLKDGKVVRKHGLNSPFDWIRGIGRGTFIPLPIDLKQQKGVAKGIPTTKEYAAPKSYFIYTLLAICLGIFGADKFYLGANWQGLAKIFSVFNIFLFLFGIMWVIWDAVHAYFMTESIMEKGITPPIPFSWFFGSIESDIFKVQEVKETAKEPSVGLLGSLIPSIPILPWRDVYRELVVPIVQPTVGSAINNVGKAVSIGTKAVALGNQALSTGPQFVQGIVQQMNEQADQAVRGTSIADVQAAAAAAVANRGLSQQPVQQATQQQSIGQSGGAMKDVGSVGGPGAVLAGAFTALILAGGLKGFYDFFSKQIQ